MILLVLITAGWTYVVIRLIRSRSAATVAAQPVRPAPLQPVAWGRLDDMQLTRLLRDAARGK